MLLVVAFGSSECFGRVLKSLIEGEYWQGSDGARASRLQYASPVGPDEKVETQCGSKAFATRACQAQEAKLYSLMAIRQIQ